MISIIKKEINSFFTGPVGYLVIGTFLLVNGLFLWVLEGPSNVFDRGFADLDPFFELAPWLLLFLVAAVCMRSFAEEIKLGTLELLLTKPIPAWQIVLGKYFGALALLIIALLPTFLYIVTIDALGNPEGNWDLGAVTGSYLGLLFLSMSFVGIGTFTSTLSANQIVAFIGSVVLGFLLYFGLNGLGNTLGMPVLVELGMQSHYENISRGLIDTRDLSYFIGLSGVLLVLTLWVLRPLDAGILNKAHRSKLFALLAFVGLYLVGSSYYTRLDLTEDKRYTLSSATTSLLEELDAPMLVEVFLGGTLPPEFRKLKDETEILLSSYASEQPGVVYRFIDPMAEGVDAAAVQEQMANFGLKGAQVEIRESGRISTEVVYPWALAFLNDRTVKIPLLKNVLGGNMEDRVNGSVQNLEYALTDGMSKLIRPKNRKIAVLKGHGELPDRQLADMVTTLKEYYYIGQFTMDSVAISPTRTLEALNGYDLALIAQPQRPFDEADKYVLDQFIMQGGRSLWLLDGSIQRLDTVSGNSFAFPLDLNLGDQLFRYGVRINPDLVKDVYAAPIALATGNERDAQYSRYPWFYSPLSSSSGNHPIVTNLEAVKFDYVSSLDTLPNAVNKTVLLGSSPISKKVGLPVAIDIDKEIPENLKVVNEGAIPESFNAGELPFAVLLEGQFTSAYKNRVKPFGASGNLDESVPNSMVIVSDGDVISNQLDRGRPLELGFDKWTNQFYGNKEFLLNTVNYLLDDDGLINIRSKEVNIPFLDPAKLVEQKGKWQLINLVLPLVILGLFGLLIRWIRKRRYAG